MRNLSSGVLPSRQHLWWAIYIRGRCPRLLFGSAFQAPECMWGTCDVDTYPLAYCPPGRGFTLSYIPRALPPVTQGSAFQAPECLRILMMYWSNLWKIEFLQICV